MSPPHEHSRNYLNSEWKPWMEKNYAHRRQFLNPFLWTLSIFMIYRKVFGWTFPVSAHTCSRDTGGSCRRNVRCSFSRSIWGIQMWRSFSSLACLEEEDMFGCEELITKPSLCDPWVAWWWTAGSWCYGSLQMSPLTYVQAWETAQTLWKQWMLKHIRTVLNMLLS